MLKTKGLYPITEEPYLAETEVLFDQFDPFEVFYEFEEGRVDFLPQETARWGYRVPCPGVKIYTIE